MSNTSSSYGEDENDSDSDNDDAATATAAATDDRESWEASIQSRTPNESSAHRGNGGSGHEIGRSELTRQWRPPGATTNPDHSFQYFFTILGPHPRNMA